MASCKRAWKPVMTPIKTIPTRVLITARLLVVVTVLFGPVLKRATTETRAIGMSARTVMGGVARSRFVVMVLCSRGWSLAMMPIPPMVIIVRLTVVP